VDVVSAAIGTTSDPKPPGHYELTRAQLIFSGASIAAALLALAACGFRIASRIDLWQWWVPLAVTGGIATADFGSGLIHWGADTWGRDDLPVIGHRLLVPFRVHHINPDDFLRRRFIDTNGDVAFLAVPILLGLLVVPIDTVWGGPAVVFGVAFSGIGMMTNQIHQWAHMPSPPRPIRVLQDCGLFLGRTVHAVHHERPYDTRYCITTGWCNRPLEAIGFFRRLEAAISRLTGARVRHDDRRYEERYGIPPAAAEGRRG
jgi:ubiquitin-conjugating enzyme E2 variant